MQLILQWMVPHLRFADQVGALAVPVNELLRDYMGRQQLDQKASGAAPSKIFRLASKGGRSLRAFSLRKFCRQEKHWWLALLVNPRGGA